MRKLKRLLALGAAVLMSVSALSVPASASNYKNTSWSFNVDSTNHWYVTSKRAKLDSSGVYVHYKAGTVNGVVCDVITVEGISMCNTLGVVYKGNERLIAQYVYENGFRECKLKLKSDTIYASGGASGEWSPDSVGSYPYCNR